MKKTLIVFGLVAVLLLAMTAVAQAQIQYDPTNLPWTDTDLANTTQKNLEHFMYLVSGSDGCLKCHAYAAGAPVPERTRGTAGPTGSVTTVTPAIPGAAGYPTGAGSFRGLRATNANDMCDYCHVAALPYSNHEYEFMNPSTAGSNAGLQKNPKSGHRVGGEGGPGWTTIGNRATPMTGKTVGPRQMTYLGAGGRPTGPPAAGALTCTSCHSVHATDVIAQQVQMAKAGVPSGYPTETEYGPLAMITGFTRLNTQLIRRNPSQDGSTSITVWPDRTYSRPTADAGPDKVLSDIPLSQQVQWYTYFCADCHNQAHISTQEAESYSVAHRWDLEPYIGVASAGAGLSLQGLGTRTDGYINDDDTWNTTDDAPTCRQCHSVRVKRPAFGDQGGDKRRPRYPHLGVTSDQLLRDNTNGELIALSSGVKDLRIAGINALDAMIADFTWPTFYADEDMLLEGEEMIVNANAVCRSCHDASTLP